MEARYNWIIDSVPIRVALNVFAFAAWLAVAAGLIGAA